MTTAIRTSARGGRAAKRFAKQERFTDRLYEHGALTRTTEAQERAIAEAQPCPVCFTFVHPSNYEKHMAQHTTNLEVVQKPLFDYAALDTETRIVVQLRTDEIKTLMRRTAQDIIDIGTKLIDVKQRLGHGAFGTWLKAEFEWTDRTARQFMRVSEVFKTENFSDLKLAPSALYLLAAPSTPEEAVNEALERAENGETITHSTAKAIVAEYKNGATPTPEPQPEPIEDDDDEPTQPLQVIWERQATDPEMAKRHRLATVIAHCHEVVAEVINRYGVTDLDTIALLKDGHANGREWFEEVRTSGYIQPGDAKDARHITDSAYQIKLAIEKRQENHKIIALDAKQYAAETHNRSVLHSSKGIEWYTPARYVNAARAVMGDIDLDPATSLDANKIVKATRFYTADDDGLSCPWNGRVWLNPPYGRDDNGESSQAVWSAYLLEEFKAGRVTEAVLLVNATTDRKWFAPLWDYLICFTNHRIRFYTPTGEADSPTHGNALIYFGSNRDRFIEVFREFGVVVTATVR